MAVPFMTRVLAENAELNHRIEELQKGFDYIRQYVASDKFNEHPYVSTFDILLRIREIEDHDRDLELCGPPEGLCQERAGRQIRIQTER